MKRKIAALMCSLAVMGMFSVNTLPAQAAKCEHKNFLHACGVILYTYHDDTGHYEVWGTQWVCTACGYSYWDDEYEHYTVKTGDHTFNSAGICTTCGYKNN